MDTTAPNFNLLDSLGNIPLLGLKLTKSLVEKRLSAMAAAIVEPVMIEEPAMAAMIEKPRAANFLFTSILIGRWQRESSREGDLMAKLYFAKRKLVWEFLDGRLKTKIEVLWDDITAINAYMPSNQPGTLQIELGKTPSFFRESNTKPKKHTSWKKASDFTCGHALHHRIHYATFPQGVLDIHYPMLLQWDHNLFELSKRPFPSQGESPYFNKAAFSQQSVTALNIVESPNIAESPFLNPIMSTVVHMDEKSDAHQTVHLGDHSGMANNHNSFHEASFSNSSARCNGQQLHVLPPHYSMSDNEASFFDSSRGQQLGSLPRHQVSYINMPPEEEPHCDGGPFMSTQFNQLQNNGGGVTHVVDQGIIAAHDPSNNYNNTAAPIDWMQHPTLQGSNIYSGVTVEQPPPPELVNYNNGNYEASSFDSSANSRGQQYLGSLPRHHMMSYMPPEEEPPHCDGRGPFLSTHEFNQIQNINNGGGGVTQFNQIQNNGGGGVTHVDQVVRQIIAVHDPSYNNTAAPIDWI